MRKNKCVLVKKIQYMKTLLLLFLLLLTLNLYCQQFQLTDINTTQYSIDKIAQQVYFKDSYTDTVRKVDLRNMSVTKTMFSILPPNFGNQHHLMRDNTAFYNLDNGTSYNIPKSESDTLGGYANSEYTGDFSPADSNFLFPLLPKIYPMIPRGYVFSFNDSSLKSFKGNFGIEYNINDAWPQWNSDTSFVFLSGGNPDSVIAKYFLKSGKVDTLVTVHPYNTIRGFSFNRKYGILAYSILGIPPTPKIYFHYVNKNFADSLIYEPENLVGGPEFTALRWSPDNNKLAFVCSRIDIGSNIYVYDLDSNKAYIGAVGGYEDHLKWANNDTLIFVDESQYLLYGLSVSSIYTSVRETRKDPLPSKFTISNYPNPFNPSTEFYINLPAKRPFSIKIYDTLGRLVKTIRVNPQNTEVKNISWDGTNNSGRVVSSGVYFAIAIVNNQIHSNTIKLILLK